MRLDEILVAHGFMQVERPPELWEADAWRPGQGPTRGLLDDVAPRADDAGSVYAYARDLGADGGSMTAFLRRLRR